MAKRDTGSARAGTRATAPASGTAPTGTMEERLLALAEQMGRIAGTIQAKAEGWMDQEALSARLATIRDSATHLVAALADRARTASAEAVAKPVKKATRTAAKSATKTAPASAAARGRSGGGVDAPGKKHRKQGPPDPDARLAGSQASKRRAAMPMEKTSRRRGRG